MTKFGEWQPIETAPKDGTQFLVYFPAEEGTGVYDVVLWSERHDAWASHYGGWGSERYSKHYEGFWLSLPEPPQ